ncbi:MAG TPA: 1,2-phenylacetyl-CoA epoxidase subunit PaaC [Acetobacteraceae bacterium]|nr:1,2-phenylacetyl-CoA epoxidase subunit PaaC [Acetobacteraceae bacterium]
MTKEPRVVWLLRRADDALVLGHRLSEWCGHAPMLEEDLALANIALDQIGLARALYQEVGAALGRDEDQLAYLRGERDYLNLLIVEQPNGDFARTIVRQLLYSAVMAPFWRLASSSTDAAIAAVAAKAEKEAAYHLRHAAEWTVRLGDGTDESRRRTEAALDWLWRFTDEMFADDDVERAMVADGAAPDLASVRGEWERTVGNVLARATLARPEPGFPRSGGRQGRHGEELGHMLAEMQHLQRAYPGATW